MIDWSTDRKRHLRGVIRDIVRTQGAWGLARESIAYAYRRAVRPCIPAREPARYAGIPICHDRKWGDGVIPTSWVPDEALADRPDYEATLVAGLTTAIRPGDSIVIIGVGLGVTAVIAALRAGASGTVECFEGSKRYVKRAQQTAARNRVTNLRIQHALVAKPIAVHNRNRDLGAALPASQLPPCDVLQLDCEGAEAEILRELTIWPRVILVETHGVYGAPTDLIASLLEKRGYIVDHLGVAEPRKDEFCRKHDIRVLLGINAARHEHRVR